VELARRVRQDLVALLVRPPQAVAAILIFVARWPMLRTLAACAALGLAAGLTGLPVG
jgi:hypothetical protein